MAVEKKYVRPTRPGLIVLDDRNFRIPADGTAEPIVLTHHLRRRIREGSLEVFVPSGQSAPAPKDFGKESKGGK